MRFNGDLAWRDALRILSGNREVLLALAGVFIFLPGLVAALFLSGIQEQMMQQMTQVQGSSNPQAAMQQMMGLYARIAPYGVAIGVCHLVGMTAMMALLTDRRRPTVGEALLSALKSLPTLVGAALVFVFGYILAMVVLTVVLAVIVAAATALLGAAGMAGGLSAVLFAVVVVIVVVVDVVLSARLSLTLPVVVIDGERNPVRALAASWRLTSGNGLRLLGFYVLLIVAYLVVALALTAVLMGLVAFGTGTGRAFTLVSGLVSGGIGAAVTTLFTGILAAIHRQLAGPSAESLTRTFE